MRVLAHNSIAYAEFLQLHRPLPLLEEEQYMKVLNDDGGWMLNNARGLTVY
ncbi:hypothetical protein P5757_09550 [Bacillus tropicus]|uniref:hypothetical protein n=1 Tax=Bacillus tropicus TaxID=2026188 RepID=UPI00240618D0|nr:hypothetical protein [Bacillus tropicus]MDF9556305.1 hypothetical protein [Bacillus tropicus]MDF9589039.1 hypothetical protein [Bacillus tropicus]MDF9646212.1 hypothetical protein [Bacillus tropicus]